MSNPKRNRQERRVGVRKGMEMPSDVPSSSIGAITASAETVKEMHEELHTLGNCLAQIKIGNRLIGQVKLDDDRRRQLVEHVNDAVTEAESVFRLLSAQLK